MPDTQSDRDLILHAISHDLHRIADVLEAAWQAAGSRLAIVDAYQRGGLLAARAARKRGNGAVPQDRP